MDEPLVLRVKLLDASARLPTQAHPDDSGFDLYALDSHAIEPGGVATIRTGIAVELPSGTEGQIRSRSGLARDRQVTVLNSPGTIDEGYRGEIRVVLINHGDTSFGVVPGMRVAQLVVQRRLSVLISPVDTFAASSRGEHGFGSTGND